MSDLALSPAPPCCPLCGAEVTLEGVTFRDNVLYYNNNMIHMTPSETRILHMLCGKPGSVVSRQMIYNEIYPEHLPDSGEVDPKIIDVFICKVRRKLKRASCDILIETIWGRGYIVRKEQK